MGKDEIDGPLSTCAGQEIASGGNKEIRIKKKSETQEETYRDWHTTEMCVVLVVKV